MLPLPSSIKSAVIAVVVALMLSGLWWAGDALYVAGQKDVQVLWDRDVIAREEENKKTLAKHRKQEQEWTTQIEKERQNAIHRETQLRSDVAAAHDATDGLRAQTVDLARRLAEAPAAAAVDAAAALGDLLANCSGRYTALAEKCDRHVSDLKTMIGSWPVALPGKETP